jgi:AIR synthase-related protein
VAHKADIAAVVAHLGIGGDDAVPVGDDTAVIPDGDGHLLFAIEGFVEDFVAADPWFAGYCGVMVNVSDVLAMGGTPIAVVDAVWSADAVQAELLLAGMRGAAARYGVPVVGGHSNLRAASGQLAVAILGRAARPVTSFGARAGDALLVATDLRGAFRQDFPWWDASTSAPAERLRGDMRIMAQLGEAGLLTAAKDISMAGVVGTAIMLAEASGVGCLVDLDRLPMPADVPMARWLTAFPSFGFVMTAHPGDAPAVVEAFAARGIACAVAARVDDSAAVTIAQGGEAAEVWNLAQPLTGCAPRPIVEKNDA